MMQFNILKEEMCCQKLSERGKNFWRFILVNYPSISLFFLYIIPKIKKIRKKCLKILTYSI